MKRDEQGLQNVRVLASGLEFPEGPMVLADGSVAFCEIRGGRVRKVSPDGRVSVVAETGGGPNGMAIGPDGAYYVCNNGGNVYRPDHFVAQGPSPTYQGGSLQRIDPASGRFENLYTHCGEHRLSSPNDIVFDRHGGFYFTDMGKKHGRTRDNGALYYAMPDGSRITELAGGLLAPNGVGLSPEEDELYFSETETGRLIAMRVLAPGQLERLPFPAPSGGRFVCGPADFHRFDSLAVQANGDICVGTLMTGRITVSRPDGTIVREPRMPGDIYPTNICFGGPGMKTAFITLSETGRLIAADWPEPGLVLNFAATS
ncbi:SMP-30/gluconolactonase/LRE family protein [soil metagenome]